LPWLDLDLGRAMVAAREWKERWTMAKHLHLDTAGYQGQPVPNELIRPEGETDHLAILLPGYGYTCDGPLFYYAESLLVHTGANILRVEYAYNKTPGFMQRPEAEWLAWLAADVTAAYRTALAQRPYRELILIGKSLGTLAIAHLLTMDDRFTGPVRAIWLTPAFRLAGLTERMRPITDPSLIVIGDADPHYDEAALTTLAETMRPEVLVVPNADHSLEIEGDIITSIAILGHVTQAIARFLGGNDGAGGPSA
jgi:predicted alpha/beta-hydrolase family hydrolase